jgi:hypothetical protein
MTSHGMMNIMKSINTERIIIGNGYLEEVEEIAENCGIICKIEIEKKVRLKNVTILSNGRLDLLIISQLLKKGWNL